jgi:hypothetical protein
MGRPAGRHDRFALARPVASLCCTSRVRRPLASASEPWIEQTPPRLGSRQDLILGDRRTAPQPEPRASTMPGGNVAGPSDGLGKPRRPDGENSDLQWIGGQDHDLFWSVGLRIGKIARDCHVGMTLASYLAPPRDVDERTGRAASLSSINGDIPSLSRSSLLVTKT